MPAETYRDADHLSLPVPADTVKGSPVRVGGLNAITVTDRAKTDVAPTDANGNYNAAYNAGGGNPDGHASCWLKGAHPFVVSFAVTDIGTPIYITSGNALTATSSGNSLFGHALSTKAGTSGPLTVRITN